ncbi:sensor histidine kinase [Haloarcula salinisoli]|uniref:histidine kinase n=1 Tax=Haloarcula salinisoli TaxID=2487746 RepID=A0A8J7YGK1_9EURY|nr:hybrid sensor histidine kinase/response regulator [Halomicroarcula salinisoli]MBX0285529.1 hybrid sensor histidine kinase/response regulator [Halomicroarcula salinisoli]MBX0302988.1 hybrid sensor histidine kinase/response regulator [Halomicroarcula salinisoli]
MSERAAERTVVVTGAESGGIGGLPTGLAERSRLTVVTAGADGLEAELNDADALVVVDDPPGADGVETFRRVRRNDWTLPVVLVSEDVDGDRVQTALSAGVTEYLTGWSADRVEELAARIEAHVRTPALDGIVQAERWKTIVGALAHDAKNPLNVVTGRLELLDVEDTHTDAIDRSVGRVQSLLSELSTVASVAGPIEGTEPVDLAEMAERVWRDSGGSAERLRVETTATVQADPDCLRLILERLFENAVVHGDDATVTVGDAESGFYVADDGPGIPAEDRQRVFEQGYGTARDGEGYGLFVAESIATSHGWDIVAGESEAGGARFEVRAR